MALSQDIVNQFAKLVDNKDKNDEGTIVKGTYKKINNKEYVQLDGSDILTPVETTVDAEDNERVQVLIKDHYATVTANITSPAARNKSVLDLKDEVDEQGNNIRMMDNTITAQGNSITLMDNKINQQNNVINQHDTMITEQGDRIISLNNTVISQNNAIEANRNSIVAQGNTMNLMNENIIAQGDTITSMNNVIDQQNNRITLNSNNIQAQGNTISLQSNRITQINDTVQSQGNVIDAQGNVIDAHENELTLHDSKITILNSAFVIRDGVLTGLSQIILDELDADYAEIDFANIDTASIKNLYATSGVIQNIRTEIIDGKEIYVAGDLSAVNISGSLINAGTIVANKLLFRTEDGLYKALNFNGEFNEVEQDETNSLNGNVIAAKSVTASKILVDDLSAFNATIGGFVIDRTKIHSVAKDTISSPSAGVYMDSDGQMVIGDDHNHIKFYKDLSDNQYKLDVRLDKLYLGANSQTADQQFQGMVELSANNITSIFRSTGGSNLLRNSVGFSNTDFWITSGNITTYQSDTMSASGSKFILQGASSLEQYYSTQEGIEYSVSFKFKHTATGNPDVVKVELIGDGDSTITLLNTSDLSNEWVSVALLDENGNPTTYNARTSTPKIKITCSANNTLEITDLIVAQGLTDVWSGFIDEVYGKEHKLDKNGLRLYSESSNDSAHMTSNSYLLKDGNNVVAELSKDRVYSDYGQFNNKYSINRLVTVALDNNNIIEYVEGS